MTSIYALIAFATIAPLNSNPPPKKTHTHTQTFVLNINFAKKIYIYNKFTSE